MSESPDAASAPPLERFLPEYLEVAGGAWEDVEPQVYDVLLPPEVVDGLGDRDGVVRVAFDPEAVQEHPGSQLLVYGSPLLDRLLAHAQAQSRTARGYLLGVNLAVQPERAWLDEAMKVPSGATWEMGPVRPLWFGHAALWFRATYLSDEKEHETYLSVVDLHYGRFARHLEGLLRAGPCEISAERPFPCPDAAARPLRQAYAMARERVAATALAVGRGHQREREERVARQVARMEGYYADLQSELAQRLAKAQVDGRTSPKTLDSLQDRLAGIARDRQVRVDELRQRSALRVTVGLTNLLVLACPKLRVEATLTPLRGPALGLTLVWDPLTAQLEPPDCPACRRATRELAQGSRGQWLCPECQEAPPRPPGGGRRS